MYKYIYRIDKIEHNNHVGTYFIQKNGLCTKIFLEGVTLGKIAPELSLKIGDRVEIIKDEKHFTTAIRKL